MNYSPFPSYGYGDLLTLGAKGGHRTVRIIKTNQSNYRCEDEQGGLWNVRIAGATPAPPGATFNPAPKDELHLGDTVRFTAHGGGARFPGTYVVAKKSSGGTAKFVRLNGGEDRVITGSLGAVEKVAL